MISDIQQICRLLEKDSLKTTSLKKELELSQHPVNEMWTSIIDDGVKLGLITVDKYSEITERGLQFYEKGKKIISLTIEQKKFIFQNCILNNEKFRKEMKFLEYFKEEDDFSVGFTLFDEEIEDENIEFVEKTQSMLEYELGVIERYDKNDGWRITDEFLEYFYEQKRKRKAGVVKERGRENDDMEYSADQSEKDRKEMKRIGEKGEELAYEYELNSLKDKAKSDVGWKVRIDDFKRLNSEKNIIARRNVRAGYDLQSFKTKNSQDVDKFIEVKSRKEKKRSFVISENEVLRGMQDPKSYLIYFYYNLGNEEPKQPTKIIKFEELKKIKLCKTCPGLIDRHYLVDISKFFRR